jgi:cyclin-dependent kinase 7
MSISLGWKYHKERKIGEGTFATVYLAKAIPPHDPSKRSLLEQRKVAMKKIKLSAVYNGIDIGALREIKYLQELKHPNIIQVSKQ